MNASLLRPLAVLAGLLTGPAFAADDALTEQPRILAAAESTAGRQMPDLLLTSITGERLSLRGTAARHKALVIAFTSPTCPLSGKLLPSLAALEREFADKGAAFLFADPAASDGMDAITGAVRQHGLKGAMIHDRDLTLAAALGASSTTEVFVMDAAATLTYRGAVDDQYGLGYAREAPRNEWLREALTATLAGYRPRIAATTAPGCALALPEGKPETAGVTWHGRVSRILQANCQECHRTGGIAPFPLESMTDAVSHAGMIRKTVAKGLMPPWFAAPRADAAHRPFANDRSLPEQDRADLLAWLDGGRPEGDAALAPLPRQWPDATWAIGKPDAVWELPRAVDVQATGKMDYVNLEVATGLTEDRWVQSIEVLPTARAQVHHVLVFVTVPDGEGKRKVRDGNNFFAAYVPGSNLLQYPAGYAKKLPAGSTLRFQMHYTPTGVATRDRTRLGVVFAPQPPLHEVKVAAAGNRSFQIPPGAGSHAEKGILPVPASVELLAFMPHMHVRGKSFRYDLVEADGTRRTLLDVPRYDFNWQLLYRLAEPVPVKAGSRIEGLAVFDNSAANPANPDPSKTVRWGEQTDDEMLLGYVEYVKTEESPDRAEADRPEHPAALQLTAKTLQILGKRLDLDHDGRVSRGEAGETFAGLHARLDTDGDGFVTAAESRVALRRRGGS